ncbi:Nucleoporin nup35 [Entomortierella chlamydospora]|uniref:Nucleoporin nup35 n=1 Tax=Entomortierella chlamydospora TaxID=101097 RepID=A0A9P6MTT9_9FUNG|nr:Nucleoporin nup35 [Entomortierella chlamydospora]
MFTFNVSGSSSHGRSSQGSSKSDYVPSTYIAKQLALEEEAKRKREQDGGQQDTHSSFQPDLSQGWPNRDEVLAPGYSAGPLGYELPKSSLHSSRTSQQLLSESVRLQESRFDSGAGVGQSDHSNASTGAFNLRSTTSAEPIPDQSTFVGSSSTASKGILRNDRPEFSKEDIQKRNSTVRFSGVAPELTTPRPQSPSIFNQGAASSFFPNGHLSTSGGVSNLHSALKENGKVDVLSHRGATSSSSLNSSLGPALGSVSGTAQSPQSYSSPRMMNSELNTSSIRGNSISGNGTSGSSFFLGLESSSMRQSGKLSNTHGKGSRGEDEEDKDKERYLPAILLSTASGLKGSKIEPFVDGKTEWDSDPFQQTGPSRDGNPRVAPHLIGEDAPPADTLYDIAQKEKYYSHHTATLSQFATPNTNSRFNTEADHLGREGSSSNGTTLSKADESYDSIITYGFPPEAASYMLNQFRAFGTVVRCETGSYGRVESESFNWLKIQYAGAWAARNAVSRHLQSVGKFIVGVHACRSFSTTHPSNMSMDTSDDGSGYKVINDLTDAEAREVEEGVDRLLRMRAQGLNSSSSQSRAGAQVEATKARHASLNESWNQGTSALGASQSSTISMGYSPTRTLSDSISSAPARTSTLDQDDDDMAYILGHSLTSGGSLARSGRGRGFEREKAEFLRSRSTDQHLGQDQDAKRVGVDGGILPESQPVETGSVGFRPLFGQNESRGLYASGSGSGLGSTQYQQQQQQQIQLFEQRQHPDAFPGSQQNHLSLRRPTFGNSVTSDTTLFAASGGVLLDASVSSSSDGPSSSSPFHVQKKQRLSSNLFAPTSVSSPSLPSSSNSGGNAPLSQFGRGRDRSTLLVDDPSLVDQWGVPLLNKVAQTTPATATSSSSAAGSAAGRTTNPAAAGSTPGSAGQSTAAAASESMISSVLTMAKKRLFWG